MKDNPAVTRNRKNLGLDREYLGAVLVTNGKPQEALREYNASIAVFESLIEDSGGVAEFRIRLAHARRCLGVLHLEMGKAQDAETECRFAVSLNRELENENPTIPLYRLAHSWSLSALGDVFRWSGRSREAKEFYDKGIALAESAVPTNRQNSEQRATLLANTWRRGLTLRDLGDFAAASAVYRRALQMCDNQAENSEELVETAACHAALAGLAGQPGSGVSAAEGQKEAEEAMKWLRRAVADGYRNRNRIRMESAFDSLRNRQDFNTLFAMTEPKAPVMNEQKR
jgi:tetratricopeptide (TPR) repeat protein